MILPPFTCTDLSWIRANNKLDGSSDCKFAIFRRLSDGACALGFVAPDESGWHGATFFSSELSTFHVAANTVELLAYATVEADEFYRLPPCKTMSNHDMVEILSMSEEKENEITPR